MTKSGSLEENYKDMWLNQELSKYFTINYIVLHLYFVLTLTFLAVFLCHVVTQKYPRKSLLFIFCSVYSFKYIQADAELTGPNVTKLSVGVAFGREELNEAQSWQKGWKNKVQIQTVTIQSKIWVFPFSLPSLNLWNERKRTTQN